MLVTHPHFSHTPPCQSHTSTLVTHLNVSHTTFNVGHTPPCQSHTFMLVTHLYVSHIYLVLIKARHQDNGGRAPRISSFTIFIFCLKLNLKNNLLLNLKQSAVHCSFFLYLIRVTASHFPLSLTKPFHAHPKPLPPHPGAP